MNNTQHTVNYQLRSSLKLLRKRTASRSHEHGLKRGRGIDIAGGVASATATIAASRSGTA